MQIRKILATLFTLITLGVSAQDANTLTGKWKGEDKPNNHVQFCLGDDGLYYGKLVFEDGKKENLGKVMMKQLKYETATKTYKGTMTPPDKNIDLKVTLTFEGNDKIKVVAKKFFMTKTVYFIRIK
jgi:hypothetical protein